MCTHNSDALEGIQCNSKEERERLPAPKSWGVLFGGKTTHTMLDNDDESGQDKDIGQQGERSKMFEVADKHEGKEKQDHEEHIQLQTELH